MQSTIVFACMGLSMFKTGLLTGAILMTFEEKKAKNFGIIRCYFFVLIVLNVFSNYFRIVTLII
jgi:hypothetical protein